MPWDWKSRYVTPWAAPRTSLRTSRCWNGRQTAGASSSRTTTSTLYALELKTDAVTLIDTSKRRLGFQTTVSAGRPMDRLYGDR